MVLFLQTTHLDLVAATLLHLDAQLGGSKPLGKLLGVVVPKEWPLAGVDDAFLQHIRDRLARDGHDAVGWYGWYAICRHTALQPSTLVGVGGFFGPPDESGTVELGFGILPTFRGRGHATEMVHALVDHALGKPGVQRIVADARAQDRPTLAVLLRCGFRMTDPPEPGLLRCERSLAAVETEGGTPTESDDDSPPDDEA